MQRLWVSIQRDNWHGVPRFSPIPSQVVYGCRADRGSEKRNQCAASGATSQFGKELQNSLVSLPSNPQGHEGRRPANGNRGSGRNIFDSEKASQGQAIR